MKPKILVTPRSVTRDGHPSLDRLTLAGYEVVMSTPGQQPGEAEQKKLLDGCVGCLAGVEPITREVQASAKSLKVISRNGIGVSSIDLEAAEQLGITILRAEGANAQGVAELTIGLLLALARDIPFSDASLKGRGWDRRKGFEVSGRTLGLIGCGMIGRRVARMAAGLGMKVLGYDPVVDKEALSGIQLSLTDLNSLLSEADITSLHCPPSPGGDPLIGRDALSKMKEGAYLINTARGELIDDDALLEALDAGRIAGVAMDAFREEPPRNHALINHNRVVATPHVGGFTTESVDRAMDAAVGNLLEFLSGK